MKAAIPGVCAVINEQALDIEAKIANESARLDRLEDEWKDKEAIGHELIAELRAKLTKYRQAVTVLQDVQELL
jgi:hypothetical protein